mgnify:CR=1 FL=1
MANNYGDHNLYAKNPQVVSEIDLGTDLDLSQLTQNGGPIVGKTDADVTNGMYTGGTTGNFHNTGLKNYELALGTGRGSTSKFNGVARTLVINGNGHTLNMGKWFISLWDPNYDGGKAWNIILKNIKLITSDTTNGFGPFHFYVSADNGKKSSITFDNVTANVTNASLVEHNNNAANVNVTIKNSNITGSGKNVIDSALGVNVENTQVQVTNGNFIDNAEDNITISGDDNNATITGGSYINQAKGTTTIDGLKSVTIKNGALIKKATGNVNITNAKSVTSNSGVIINTTKDLTIAGQNSWDNTLAGSSTSDNAVNANNVTIADDAVLRLNVTNPTVSAKPENDNTYGNNAFYIGSSNSSKGTLESPTDNGNFTVGKNAQVTFNDKLVTLDKDGNIVTDQRADGVVHNLRFMYNVNAQGGNVIFEEGANVKLYMGKGHSVAIHGGNLLIDKNANVDINTLQDNNNVNSGLAVVGGGSATRTHNGFHWGVIALDVLDTSIGDIHVLTPKTNEAIINGSLKIVRGKAGEDINTVSPLISIGSGSSNEKAIYSLTVGNGGTLDLQDSASTAYDQNAYNKAMNWIGTKDKVYAVGLIGMWGTGSTDTITFNSPKYINLQRRGSQIGNAIRLEGNKNNIVVQTSDAKGLPLAQWNDQNQTDTPDEACRIQQMKTQSAGGTNYSNFLPSGATAGDKGGQYFDVSGFLKSKYFGTPMDKSNATVVMAPFIGDYKFVNGSYQGLSMSGVQGVGLMQLTNDFSWWAPRRISLGNNGSVTIQKYVDYEPIVQTIHKTVSDTVAGLTTKDLQDGINYLKGSNNTIAQDHKTLLSDSSYIDWTNSSWGLDWSKTDFTEDGHLRSNPTADLTTAQNNIYNILKKISQVQPSQTSDGHFKVFTNTDDSFNGRVATIVYKDSSNAHPSVDFVLIPIDVRDLKQAEIYRAKYFPTIGYTVGPDNNNKNVISSVDKLNHGLNAAIHFYQKSDLSKTVKVLTGVTYTKYNESYGRFQSGWKYASLNEDGSITYLPGLNSAISGEYYLPVTIKFSDGSTSLVLEKLDLQLIQASEMADSHDVTISGAYSGSFKKGDTLDNDKLSLTITADNNVKKTLKGKDDLRDLVATVGDNNQINLKFGPKFAFYNGMFGPNNNKDSVVATVQAEPATTSLAINPRMLFASLFVVKPNGQIFMSRNLPIGEAENSKNPTVPGQPGKTTTDDHSGSSTPTHSDPAKSTDNHGQHSAGEDINVTPSKGTSTGTKSTHDGSTATKPTESNPTRDDSTAVTKPTETKPVVQQHSTVTEPVADDEVASELVAASDLVAQQTTPVTLSNHETIAVAKQQDSKDDQQDTAAHDALPQTGNHDSALAGLGLASFMTMFGLIGKRHRQD